MFRPKRKYAFENNLCTRRIPNRSFSIPKNALDKKVKKGGTKKVESEYFKENSEWTSCSSSEEICNTEDIDNKESSSCSIEQVRNIAEETDFSLFPDPFSLDQSLTLTSEFGVQSIEGEFKPIAKSTPKNILEPEHLLKNDFSEEADNIGEEFIRDKFPTTADELQPMLLSEQFHILDLIDNTSITNEDQKEVEICQVEGTENQVLPFEEQHSASETLRKSDYSNKRSSRKTEDSPKTYKKNQSNQKSKFLKNINLISNIKARNQRQSNSIENGNHRQNKDFQNIPQITPKSAKFEKNPKNLLEVFQDSHDPDSQLYEKDLVPRKKYFKKKITKSTQNSRTKDQSSSNAESNRKLNRKSAKVLSKNSNPANNCKTRKQSQPHLTTENTHTQSGESQNHNPTSSKDTGSVTKRISFKTLGYCTQKKGQNLQICDIIKAKDRFHLG